MTRVITETEMEAARTPAGGWTRKTLAGWGVPWPPPRGWRQRLLRGLPPMETDPVQMGRAAASINPTWPASWRAPVQPRYNPVWPGSPPDMNPPPWC